MTVQEAEVPTQSTWTFNVNTASVDRTKWAPNGIYLAGGVFGDAQAQAMSDDDDDGVWTVTLEVANGLSGTLHLFEQPQRRWRLGSERKPCGS